MLLLGLISTIIMIIVAKTKGFNVWSWILAGGLFGLIVVSFLPSAKADNIDEDLRQKRKEKASSI
jgi:accessory gene regulator protein AgrB